MHEPPRRRSIPSTDAADSKERRRELLVVWGDELRAFELPETGRAGIGRAEDNEIRIEHDSVSRWHAALHLGSSLVLEDLGAANGTFIPDRARPVAPGETRNLRRLDKDRSEVRIGESIIFGAVSAVVRHLPSRYEAETGVSSSSLDGDATVMRDPSMQVLHAEAGRAAQASISVLVLGETGVGKEVMARSIHARSARKGRVFMGLNCAAFNEQLLEGELFGYERGAFTGAVQARPGLFEAADGGTVFLDEVGELPQTTQTKLLRVLEERSVMRIGARRARAVDVRFIAATNRDLMADVERGTFREDLFYRLNGMSLTIPPLRERPTELDPLVRGFVAAACRQLERRSLGVSDGALRVLTAHSWPGNVRELKNAIERAVVLCTGDVIGPEHLPLTVSDRSPARPGGRVPVVEPVPPQPRAVAELGPARFAAQVAALERARIVDALDRTGGNQTEAAKLLGVARRTLISRLEALNLPRPRKRPT